MASTVKWRKSGPPKLSRQNKANTKISKHPPSHQKSFSRNDKTLDILHLVAIVAAITNRETLAMIGECVSIHHHKKHAGMKDSRVYGIYSTSSFWKFVFIDKNETPSSLQKYYLNAKNYVKECPYLPSCLPCKEI
ncbi:hypothetical protein BDEG_27371 [Batrachochytrium dendrobatidis JEL423]|uniref:Uncharacterized protein n=1 Tax=Batrachochytrium dendrobatidis (strain JEL423) TaxID=403673 RepID=A0A177WXJ7_BATDL|nr:hypothetical protein BDEG_27371 [Batrachochytrium dendrobatidis JEL423]